MPEDLTLRDAHEPGCAGLASWTGLRWEDEQEQCGDDAHDEDEPSRDEEQTETETRVFG